MRIAIGEVMHETNTFRPGITEITSFKALQWEHGEEIRQEHTGVRDSLGGMLAGGARLGVEIVPTFAATAEPSATIGREAFETLQRELLSGLAQAMPVDAVCLSLHGAGSAEGCDDIEGAILAEVRKLIGPDVPLVVTLDLHGHLTQAMQEHADILLNCHEYPHVDLYERGVEAVELAVKLVRREIAPVTHAVILPMLLPPATTLTGPGKTITDVCYAREQDPSVIDCAIVHGFPHTDVPICSTAVVVTTDGEPETARRIAEEVATTLWEMREEFREAFPDPVEAVAQGLALEALPVVIAEISDNSGGGAPGDGTYLLRALLEADAPGTAFGFITDAEVARQAHSAGVGATITISLGGKSDNLHGEPIVTEAYVKALTDGRFRLTNPMGAGSEVNLGLMARLVIGQVDVLVASDRAQTLDPEVFLLHGIDVTRYKVVALKSQQHFRGGFAGVAGAVIRTDSPGATTSTLSNLPYRRVQRPIWPLDDVEFTSPRG
ncbi:MAG: M81 family metallopeptidase [Thermomicrobiales bacterium]